MFLFDTHRSVAQRLRLSMDRDLGAGNIFWQACRVADDLDRPILFQPRGAAPIDDIQEYSLSELRSRVVRYANWYSTHGVGPSSRVGVYTASGLHGLLHHFAITSIGAVTVLANPKMAPDMATRYFRRTRVNAIIGDADRVAAYSAAGATAELTAVVDEIDHEAPPSSATAPEHAYRHAPDDVILISHSSGTTGVPKPTVFAHRGFFVGKRERLWNFPSRRGDRMLTALPHSHSAGISYLSLALMLGLPTLMIDEATGAGVASAMNRFHPTIVLGFPVSLAELPIDQLSAAAKRDVHTWIGMGDASHEAHIRPLTQLGRRHHGQTWLAGSTYIDGLGSSEMGMVLFKIAHTPETAHYGRMIGKPVGVVREAAVLDEHGRPLPAGRAGLLGVRTPSVTPGYWEEPELTEKARRGGYFLTGDVVRRDEDGNFYHLDRTPDVITTVDGPVYSLPIEEIVLTVTGALDTAVVAVGDPDHPSTARPIAVALFKDHTPPPAEELLARCNAALERAGLCPLRALVVAADRSELPVGVTGKVLKRVLRERHHDLLHEHSAGPGVALTSG
ncbi:MAG: class I adenylate-forming enzyme family protein [Pseudonocardiaceae bacterium]